MASRPLIIASLLGASVGVPYVASHATQGLTAPTAPAATAAPNAAATPTTASLIPQISAPSAPATSPALLTTPPASAAQPAAFSPQVTAAQPVAGYPLAPAQIRLLPPVTTAPAATTYAPAAIATLPSGQFSSASQVLRFDVTKDWVCRNWPRKSTGPTDVGLFAIRVPLVMGTQMSSLVGALTYYFNSQDQVEHISFRGRTGDATPLVQYLMQTYRFQPVISPTGEKIFQVSSDAGLLSELRLRPESVLDSNLPQQSIAVELELARPGSQRVLPPHGPALQIPQVDTSATAATSPATQSTPTPPASPTNAAAPAAASADTPSSGGYWEQVHYATQDEQSPLFNKRWPQ